MSDYLVNEKCPVCLEELTDNVCHLNNCLHKIHLNCIYYIETRTAIEFDQQYRETLEDLKSQISELKKRLIYSTSQIQMLQDQLDRVISAYVKFKDMVKPKLTCVLCQTVSDDIILQQITNK